MRKSYRAARTFSRYPPRSRSRTDPRSRPATAGRAPASNRSRGGGATRTRVSQGTGCGCGGVMHRAAPPIASDATRAAEGARNAKRGGERSGGARVTCSSGSGSSSSARMPEALLIMVAAMSAALPASPQPLPPPPCFKNTPNNVGASKPNQSLPSHTHTHTPPVPFLDDFLLSLQVSTPREGLLSAPPRPRPPPTSSSSSSYTASARATSIPWTAKLLHFWEAENGFIFRALVN